MSKRKKEEQDFEPSKKLNFALSLDNLPTDVFVNLIEYLETDDIVALRRTNTSLFWILNLGTLLKENEFLKFIVRCSFDTGLIYPFRNTFRSKINFYRRRMLLSLHQIKPVDEIKRIVKFFGTNPDLPCGFEEWEPPPGHVNVLLDKFNVFSRLVSSIFEEFNGLMDRQA